jgi:hypothetical protein
MFSYPPSPISCASHNLVSDGHSSSPTMHSGVGIGTGEEKGKIMLVEILQRCSSVLETLGAARERIEFPRLDGTSDLLQWIHRCECYIRARRTLEHRCVAYAAFHVLDDAHVWYHRLPGNGRPPTWEHFVLLIAAPFGPQITHGGGSGAGDIQGGGGQR